MNKAFQKRILQALQAEAMFEIESVQSLWSGYGAIKRYDLANGKVARVIVKEVRLAGQGGHPRGWNTDLSHQRKMRSYQVEQQWYQHFSQYCDDACRVPDCYGVTEQDQVLLLALEDLDAAGFPVRRTSVNDDQLYACLSWLANFHAVFMGRSPQGLWPMGTYWHLQTRPDELAVLDDASLKQAAPLIDKALAETPYLTLLHGDAKLANFCFSKQGDQVAAVDFQYVGGGCGMKDVAYFIGSCLDEEACRQREQELLGFYFQAFKQALAVNQLEMDAEAVESNWRDLFPFAWADFHRFLKGWSPGHWKINGYSESLTRQVVKQLLQG